MLNFETIASSSAGCCYVVTGGGAERPLMIDCGISLPTVRKATRIPLTTFAGCLVSHLHQDHCTAAKDLIGVGVDVWASRETIDAINTDRPYRTHELVPGGWTAVGDSDWQVLAFPVEHDCAGALGFVVASPAGDRLLYLTDSCFSRHRFVGLTHIAAECNHSEEILRNNANSGAIDSSRFARTSRTHMSIERLEQFLDSCDLSAVRSIYLLHLSDSNSDEAGFKQRIEQRYGIPCSVAPAMADGGVR